MKWLSQIILGSILVLNCKSNVEEMTLPEDQNIVHGVNDQIIDGKFVGKNDLGIEHIITIHKIDDTHYNVIFNSDNPRKNLNYNINSKASFNGYAMVIPVEYQKKISTILLNFNSKTLELSFENDAENQIKNFGITNNNLPKVYQHISN